MGTIKVGDYVKSVDFDARDDCYVLGTVVEIGRFENFFNDCNRYKILVDRIIFCGKDEQLPDVPYFVYPPENGTPTWLGRVTDGVTKATKQ